MMTMPPSRIDPERLAALLDKKLAPADREALLRELELSPADIEVLADATAVIEERRVPNRRFSTAARWLAAAAVIAIVTLPAMRVVRSQRIPAYLEIQKRIASPSAAQLAPAYITRGGEESPAQASLGIKTGISFYDFVVRRETNDATTRASARRFASHLRALPAGAVVASQIEGRDAAIIAANAEAVAGRTSFRAGVWLAAAHVAATRHDEAFFKRRAEMRAVAGALDSALNLPSVKSEMRELERLLEAHPVDWTRIQGVLDAIIDSANR